MLFLPETKVPAYVQRQLHQWFREQEAFIAFGTFSWRSRRPFAKPRDVLCLIHQGSSDVEVCRSELDVVLERVYTGSKTTLDVFELDLNSSEESQMADLLEQQLNFSKKEES